jgi:LmbE family N-acetylglucosaminyl deacetylase
VRLVREIRPQVVATFGPDGAYGHPDHIAICQLTSAALVCAADSDYRTPPAGDSAPHRVSKFYYFLSTKEEIAAYVSIFGDLVMHVDGHERRAPMYDEWLMTTWVDTSEYWRVAWEAIGRHRSQVPGEVLDVLKAQSAALWKRESFYRVYSLVNGGREIETDLFEGLR